MPDPVILFRSSLEALEELEILKQSKFKVYERILSLPHDSLIIGRYSVLPFYQELEQELKIINSRLINSYEEHRYVADIENWYNDLKEHTPKTYFEWLTLPENSYVVKGRTNSRKFQWNRQMFCPTKEMVSIVAQSLMDDYLIRDQGLCVRKYISLKQYGTGINGLPITNEWRIFCYKNKIISGGYYWSNFPEYKPYEFNDLPDKAHELLKNVIPVISKNINFYVVDIAETTNGDWIVIELNDAQMSGLSENDATIFYDNLYSLIG